MKMLRMALGLSLVVACADLTDGGPPVSSPVDVVLTVGGEVTVDSLLRLRFVGVPGDSRCPSSVMCIWAGDGAVAIVSRVGTGPSLPDTLHTTLDPHAVHAAGYWVTLLDLMPYPETPGEIPLDDYAARLRIERIRR